MASTRGSLYHANGVQLPSTKGGNGWHLQSNSTIPDASAAAGAPTPSDSEKPRTIGRRARRIARTQRRRGQAVESPHDTATVSPSAHTDHELRKALHDAYRPFNEEFYAMMGRYGVDTNT